mmetsp:Transcript_30760/g.67466  ORF Transcript_30760/g.67466 Transcript_30760/m.67466 type:complete len:165 (-) Transcript_30760:675-1169(-)
MMLKQLLVVAVAGEGFRKSLQTDPEDPLKACYTMTGDYEKGTSQVTFLKHDNGDKKVYVASTGKPPHGEGNVTGYDTCFCYGEVLFTEDLGGHHFFKFRRLNCKLEWTKQKDGFPSAANTWTKDGDCPTSQCSANATLVHESTEATESAPASFLHRVLQAIHIW